MIWTVRVTADSDPGPGIRPELVPSHLAQQTFAVESAAVAAAKRAAIPGWFVTVTEPNGESWGI